MMEVEIENAAVVATKAAAAAGLDDEQCAQFAVPSRDRLADAPLAAVANPTSSAPIAMKLDQAMAGALP